MPATNRDYVRDMQAEPDAVNKLAIYAAAISQIHVRLGPLFGVLQTAAPSSPELAALWRLIAERRAANMRLLAADLATTGRLRSTVQEAADVIWATNSPEFYLLLVRDRQWTHEHYEQWLADSGAGSCSPGSGTFVLGTLPPPCFHAAFSMGIGALSPPPAARRPPASGRALRPAAPPGARGRSRPRREEQV